jgi:hypothetical protein
VVKLDGEFDVLKKYQIIPKFKIKEEEVSFYGLYEECLSWIKTQQAKEI